MDNINVIDEQQDRQMEPYMWAINFTVYMFVTLVCFSFIIGPPVLLIIFKNAWLLLLFLLIFPAFWMIKIILRTLQKLAWNNRHLSTYTLERDKILFEVWEENERLPSDGTITLTSIDHVVLANRIVKNSSLTKNVKQTTIEPVLHLIYTKNGNKTLLSIPFHRDSRIDTWLQTFENNKITLYRDEASIEGKTDSDKLTRYRSTEQLQHYSFKNNGNPRQLSLLKYRKQQSKEPEQETAPNSSDAAVETELEANEKPQPKRKLTAKKWAFAALKAYSLLIVGIYIFVLLAEQGIISGDSLLTVLLFFIVSYLYFIFLKLYLRWYHMIRFIIGNFIICLIFAMIFDDRNSPAGEITSLFLGLSMFFLAVVWIPYLIAKKRGNRQTS